MLMPDVSYDYYFTVYNGGAEGTIPSESFDLFCRKATEEVALRICTEPGEAHKSSVCLAICEIAELIYSLSKRDSVKSENIDGYSVTYTESSSALSRIYAILQKHLAKSGLLFRGV